MNRGILIAGIALSALDAAASAVGPRYRPATPQTPENAAAQRSAAEEKRRRKNAKRRPVNPHAMEAE